MLKELSTTMAWDLGVLSCAVEKEKTAGFANTSTINTNMSALKINRIISFILDLVASSPWDEIRKLTAGKLFFTPLFRDIR
jgi:hypothetical protein